MSCDEIEARDPSLSGVHAQASADRKPSASTDGIDRSTHRKTVAYSFRSLSAAIAPTLPAHIRRHTEHVLNAPVPTFQA